MNIDKQTMYWQTGNTFLMLCLGCRQRRAVCQRRDCERTLHKILTTRCDPRRNDCFEGL